MAWSNDVPSMGLNGHSFVFLATPTGSAYGLIGYVAEPLAKLAPLNEETTQGKATVAWDATLEAKLINSAPGDLAMAVGNRVGDMKVVGPAHTAELKNVFIQVAFQKTFGNKTGQSFIQITAEYPAMGAAAPASTYAGFGAQSVLTFLTVST